MPALLDRFREGGFSLPEGVLRSMSDREIVKLAYRDVGIDAVLPFFQEVLRRATLEEAGASRVRVATVEDLVVLKLVAGRAQDWSDVSGLIAGYADGPDLAYVRDRAAGLLPPEDEARLDDFEERVRQYRKS